MSQKDEPPKSPPRLAPVRPIESGSAPVRPPEGSPARFGRMPDFDTIEAAVRETARGRAFLDEYKRRCFEQESFKTGSQETQSILAAIDRLESVVKSQAIEMAQRQIEAKLNSQNSSDVSSVVHAPVLAEELASLAQKLKLRGQALDLAEKLLSLAQNLAQNQPFNLAREKPYLPPSSPVAIMPAELVKPDENAAVCVQNRGAFDAASLADSSMQVAAAKTAPPATVSPATVLPVKAKSPAFFLPAMEITNLEDEVVTPQPFHYEPDFAQTQKLPEALPPDFMTLPSTPSLPSGPTAQKKSTPEFSTPEFYHHTGETSAPLQDYLSPEPMLELSQGAMQFDHAEPAKDKFASAEFASAEFVTSQFDIQSLADVEKLSAEEQMALFC